MRCVCVIFLRAFVVQAQSRANLHQASSKLRFANRGIHGLPGLSASAPGGSLLLTVPVHASPRDERRDILNLPLVASLRSRRSPSTGIRPKAIPEIQDAFQDSATNAALPAGLFFLFAGLREFVKAVDAEYALLPKTNVTMAKVEEWFCSEITVETPDVEAIEQLADEGDGWRLGTCRALGYTERSDFSMNVNIPIAGSPTMVTYMKPAVSSDEVSKDVAELYERKPKVAVTLYRFIGDKCSQITIQASEGEVDSFSREGDGWAPGTCAAQGYTEPDFRTTLPLPLIGKTELALFREPNGQGEPDSSPNFLQRLRSSTAGTLALALIGSVLGGGFVLVMVRFPRRTSATRVLLIA